MALKGLSEKAAIEREAELESAFLLKNHILQDYAQWEGFLLSSGVKEKTGEGSGLELGNGESIVGLGVLMALKSPIGGALAIAMGSQKGVFEIADPACLLSGVIKRFTLLEGDIQRIYRIRGHLNEKERLRLDIISRSLSLSKMKVASLRKKLGCCKGSGKCKGDCHMGNASQSGGPHSIERKISHSRQDKS